VDLAECFHPRYAEPVLDLIEELRAGTSALSRSPAVRADPSAIVFDLSERGTLNGVAVSELDLTALGAAIETAMSAAGTELAFGRYAEPRAFYRAASFTNDASGEPRTVHMGIDAFARPGTPVFAPLDSEVVLVADNAAELDYGPLVILEHRSAGQRFFTLYGHLGIEVLTTLSPGQTLKAGQAFATIGAPPSNGNWPPHLHLQLITDLLGLGADFPGVCSAKDRQRWLSLSPSPAFFFPELDAERLEYPSR
jgi:murein DD-endopeptidase MepM/ murein hydrolase activator NlpD